MRFIFLDKNIPAHRIVRRALFIGVLTFLVIVFKDWIMPLTPDVWIPVMTALLAGIDKTIGELKSK